MSLEITNVHRASRQRNTTANPFRKPQRNKAMYKKMPQSQNIAYHCHQGQVKTTMTHIAKQQKESN